MVGIHLEIKVVCWIISEFRRAIKLEQTQYINSKLSEEAG